MYTLKFNLKKYLSENSGPKNKLSALFQKRLEDGTDNVIFKIENDYVIYSVYDETLGFFSFTLQDDSTLFSTNNNNSNYSKDLINTFISYVVSKDKKSTKKELMARYGSFYEEFNYLKSLSKEEITKYKKDRQNLNELISSINSIDEIKVPDFQIYSIDFDLKIYLTYYLTVKVKPMPGGKKKASLNDIHQILDKFFFNNMTYNLEESTERIFEKLSSLYLENTTQNNLELSLPHTESCNFKFYNFIEAIIKNNENINAPKANISFDGHDIVYLGEDDVVISISENGTLTSSFIPSDDSEIIYVEFKKAAILFNSHYYKILKFSSQKAIKIFRFLIENRNIRYDLIQNNITTSLVPKVASDVQVAPSLVAKSFKLINHIELFLSLEKDGIKSETRTFIKGEQVSLEQYKLTEEKGFNDFSFEMQKLFLPFNGTLKDEDQISAYLSADLSLLKKTATIFISEDLKKLKKRPVSKINIVINQGQDWFKMNFNSDIYSDEDIKAILQAYKKKKKYFLLKDDYLSLQEGEFAKALERLADDFDFDEKIFEKKIPIYQVLKLQDNPLSVISKDIAKLFNEIKEYDDVELNISENLIKILRPYQIKGVKWLTMLKKHSLGGILADDMGLGKTLEMIAFLSQDTTEMPSLIITPKSLAYNWENEFKQWNPNQRVIVLSLEKDSRHKLENEIKPDENIVYIIPYDSLRNDLDNFKNIKFNYAIIDEGQYISNAISKKSRAIKQVTAEHKFALTGTPIQNSLLDLWSIFDFLMPGYFRSLNQFKKTYGKLNIDDDNKKHLEKIISPFVLKRKKEDVLTELPGKVVEIKTLSMSKEERDIYNVHLLQAKNLISVDGQMKKIVVLAALTRLRQICVDPSTFLEYNELSSKLEYTLDMLKQATSKGHKVLVFSSFKQTLEHLEKELSKTDITYEKIIGDTSAKKRVELADEFNKQDTIKVMLISLKAGGTGLNLIGADIVIHLDPWWNVASEDQATDRAYRIGQEKKVTVYKLVMKDTIEEKVIDLQEKKRHLAQIIEQNGEEKTNLTDEDIIYLLSG